MPEAVKETLSILGNKVLLIIASSTIGITFGAFATNLSLRVVELLAVCLAIAMLILLLVLLDPLKKILNSFSVQVEARYEEDVDLDGNRRQFYEILREFSIKAESEILAISSVISSRDSFTNKNTEARERYWQFLTRLVEQHLNTNKDFTYIRYYQVDKDVLDTAQDNKLGDILERYGDPTLEHTVSLIRAKSKLMESTDCHVQFSILQTIHNYGFILIDRRILIFIMDSFDRHGKPYQVGLYIVENSRESVSAVRSKFFKYSSDIKKTLDLNDFSESILSKVNET